MELPKRSMMLAGLFHCTVALTLHASSRAPAARMLMGTAENMALVEQLRQDNMKLEGRLRALNNGVVVPTACASHSQASSHNGNIFNRIKDAGVAGIISFGLVQTAFWAASVPVCFFAYTVLTGHFPDLSNEEDMAKFGAEAFAWVNVVRFAAPLRIGVALSAVPWVQANIVDVFSRDHDEDLSGGPRPWTGSASESSQQIDGQHW